MVDKQQGQESLLDNPAVQVTGVLVGAKAGFAGVGLVKDGVKHVAVKGTQLGVDALTTGVKEVGKMVGTGIHSAKVAAGGPEAIEAANKAAADAAKKKALEEAAKKTTADAATKKVAEETAKTTASKSTNIFSRTKNLVTSSTKSAAASAAKTGVARTIFSRAGGGVVAAGVEVVSEGSGLIDAVKEGDTRDATEHAVKVVGKGAVGWGSVLAATAAGTAVGGLFGAVAGFAAGVGGAIVGVNAVDYIVEKGSEFITGETDAQYATRVSNEENGAQYEALQAKLKAARRELATVEKSPNLTTKDILLPLKQEKLEELEEQFETQFVEYHASLTQARKDGVITDEQYAAQVVALDESYTKIKDPEAYQAQMAKNDFKDRVKDDLEAKKGQGSLENLGVEQVALVQHIKNQMEGVKEQVTGELDQKLTQELRNDDGLKKLVNNAIDNNLVRSVDGGAYVEFENGMKDFKIPTQDFENILHNVNVALAGQGTRAADSASQIRDGVGLAV